MPKTYLGLPKNAKCTRCRERAEIRLPSHNARFCRSCFLHFFCQAVDRAMKKMKIDKNKPLMVAVSGGKDSLAVWDVLNELGYKTEALYLNLNIPDFSEASRQAITCFAQERGLTWVEYSLQEEFGYSIPEIEKKFKRKICSICGRLKRNFFNRLSVRQGYDLLVTGHNLDDEASRLLGNLIGNRQEFLSKQHPHLPSPHPLIPARIKPLYRVSIDEILIYCELRSIKPLQINCPYSSGATSHFFKQALDFLEDNMPGTKRNFLYSYLKGKQPINEGDDFGICQVCGYPAYYQICGVCRLKRQIQEKRRQ